MNKKDLNNFTDEEILSLKRKRVEKPPTSIESEENEMISLAVKEAKRRIKNGKASDTLLAHYLRLGSIRERSEREKLDKEVTLLEAKANSLKSAERSEELYTKALEAMRTYSGQSKGDELE